MAGETSGPDTEAAAAAAASLAAQVAASASQDLPNTTTSLSHSIDKLDGTLATGQSTYNAWRFRLLHILKEKSLSLLSPKAQGLPRLVKIARHQRPPERHPIVQLSQQNSFKKLTKLSLL